MSESKNKLVRNWLIKAKHDIEPAEALANNAKPYLDTAIFHCQQSAEKAIKGFLVFNDKRFKKTHDLRMLMEEIIVIEPDGEKLLNDVILLTPYATAFRYPGEVMEPDREDFDVALKSAKKIFEFILSKLPDPAKPE